MTTEPSTAWCMICTGAVGALVQGGWGEWLTSMHRVWLTAMDWVGGCKVGWVCVDDGLWGELRGWVTVDCVSWAVGGSGARVQEWRVLSRKKWVTVGTGTVNTGEWRELRAERVGD